MLKKLTLDNFKNFRHAELELGPFTVLIGANATGKSNIREAFRFLHGIGRGYTIAEIIGEKNSPGERAWSGMRGGARELTYISENVPSPSCSLQLLNYQETPDDILWTKYDIEVTTGYPDDTPQVISEKLTSDRKEIFEAYIDGMGDVFIVGTDPIDPGELWHSGARWDSMRPVLHQAIPQLSKAKYLGHVFDFVETAENAIETITNQLGSMRFLKLAPNAMRDPSFPGRIVLGDKGENLSSVLYAICQDTQQKRILLSWIEELPEMDIVDFEFPTNQDGSILVSVVERNGQRISAQSLSDGTLRFLAVLAAFLGPERAKFYFFEELENGIHPTRLHLLTHFIENQVAKGDIQVVTTTHSPLLLNYLSPETLEHTALCYRLEDQPDGRIKRIVDIPEARDLIAKQGVMRLYESGWFEDMVALLDDDEPAAVVEVAA